jgi:hypothetical protein
MTLNPKENLLRAIRRDNPEWVPDGLEATVTIASSVVERPALAGLDDFGVHWSYEAGAEGGTYPTPGGHTIEHIRRWRDQIQIPDVAALDWGDVQAQAQAVDRDTSLVMGFVEMGLFERSYLLLGMEASLMAYVTEPQEMANMLGAIADFKIEVIAALHRHAQLDILWYGDDWGTQSNLFMPPDTWRQTIKPHTKRIYDCTRALGIVVNQHSCGKIESIVGDMVEMDADMWNPCQPCNDLAELKHVHGTRLTFCGGIDSQFVLGRPGVTPSEVRAEVRKRIEDLAAGGGYIAAPSHSVPYDPAIVDAMHDEIATYGREVYRHRGRMGEEAKPC